MLQEFKRQFPPSHLSNVSAVLSDASALAFPTGSFDIVMLVNTLSSILEEELDEVLDGEDCIWRPKD